MSYYCMIKKLHIHSVLLMIGRNSMKNVIIGYVCCLLLSYIVVQKVFHINISSGLGMLAFLLSPIIVLCIYKVIEKLIAGAFDYKPFDPDAKTYEEKINDMKRPYTVTSCEAEALKSNGIAKANDIIEFETTLTRNYKSDNDNGFEDRLFRARTESFEIRKCNDGNEQEYIIHNNGNGHEYVVSDKKCECDDFMKRGLPCKHMIYLAIHSGSIVKYEKAHPAIYDNIMIDEPHFIPKYWNYYSGEPTGLGYTNLYPFSVRGREHGISTRTGRPTSRKKTILVFADGEVDARQYAETMQVDVDNIIQIDYCPSENQYRYLHGAKIPFPYLINEVDVGALLDRYEDADDDICPQYLFDMASKRRVMVSYFSSPVGVTNAILHKANENELVELYCYSVWCKENHLNFGEEFGILERGAFKDFKLDQTGRKYLSRLEYCNVARPNKNSNAYKAACEYLLTSSLKSLL